MLPSKVFKLHLNKNVKKSVLDVFREGIHNKFTWRLFWDYLQTGVESTGVVNDPTTQLRNLRYQGSFNHDHDHQSHHHYVSFFVLIVKLNSIMKYHAQFISERKEPSQRHRTFSEPAHWLCSLAHRRILLIMIIRKLQKPSYNFRNHLLIGTAQPHVIMKSPRLQNILYLPAYWEPQFAQGRKWLPPHIFCWTSKLFFFFICWTSKLFFITQKCFSKI